MAYESSMVYTMGTALNQALLERSTVSILVNGVWLAGAVVAYDGTGVVLDNGDEHSIVKVDAVAAIKVAGDLPDQLGVDRSTSYAPTGQAMPMPGPRTAT